MRGAAAAGTRATAMGEEDMEVGAGHMDSTAVGRRRTRTGAVGTGAADGTPVRAVGPSRTSVVPASRPSMTATASEQEDEVAEMCASPPAVLGAGCSLLTSSPRLAAGVPRASELRSARLGRPLRRASVGVGRVEGCKDSVMVVVVDRANSVVGVGTRTEVADCESVGDRWIRSPVGATRKTSSSQLPLLPRLVHLGACRTLIRALPALMPVLSLHLSS